MESKHHKLVRSVRSGTVSHEMKPNAAVRDQLNVSFFYSLKKTTQRFIHTIDFDDFVLHVHLFIVTWMHG